jgi:hypothetical protein
MLYQLRPLPQKSLLRTLLHKIRSLFITKKFLLESFDG